MAGEEQLGSIVYQVELEVGDLINSQRQVNASFDSMDKGANRASNALDGLERSSQKSSKAIVRSSEDASQAARMMEVLGNEVAILEERQQNGARAAVVLAAELRAGTKATDAQRKEIGVLAGELYDLKNAQDQVNSAQQKSTGIMSGVKTGLTAIASAIAVSQLIQYGKQFLEIADTMTQLQARIDRLSSSAKEGAATFQALASIASSSGASLKDTEKLWETLTSSLKSAGATNDQILTLTSTLQKIGRIGGSSSEEMANALRQFGQSIAGGTVRAEEFNSIIEQMPELARQMAAGLGISVGELRKRMLEGKLSAEDALNAIMTQTGLVNQEFSRLPRTVDQATNGLIISFQEMVKQINDVTGASTGMVHVIDSITAAIDRLSGKVPTATQQISDLNSTAEMFARRAKTYSYLGLDGWAAQAEGINAVSNKAAALVGDLAAISNANSSASNQPIKVAGAGDSKEVDKLEKSTKRKLELSKLEGEARARLQAQYDAEDAGIKDNGRIKALQDEYAATEKNTSARKTSNAEGKKSASQAESITEKLSKLKEQSELTGESTRQLSRDQSILNAQQSLGAAATPEQIKLAGDYAAAKWDTASALRAQANAEKMLPESKENATYKQDVADLKTALSAKKISQEQFNSVSEKLEQDHQTKLAQIRANRAVSPQQEAAGMVDPVQQLANENAKKLALIQQYEANKAITEQRGIALRNAANTEYEKARTDAMWQLWSQQSAVNGLLASGFETLASSGADAFVGVIDGSMSATDALKSVGEALLKNVISSLIQMGVQYAMNAILANASIAAITTTSSAAAGTLATAWAPAAAAASLASFGANAVPAAAGITATYALTSGLSSTGLAGARKNGGPVSAGSMYQVGEGGMPEIYQSSSGRQYMIPGDNGSVISNKDMQSGGSGSSSGITVIIQNMSSNAGVQDYQTSKDQSGNDVLQIAIADINNGGALSQAISNNHQAPRRATQ